jgi:hypothetical protein
MHKKLITQSYGTPDVSGEYTMLGAHMGVDYYSNGVYWLFKIGTDFYARLMSIGADGNPDLSVNWATALSGTDGLHPISKNLITRTGFGQTVYGTNPINRRSALSEFRLGTSVVIASDEFGYVPGVEPESFKIRVQTTSSNQEFYVNTGSSAHVVVDWGDGTSNTYTTTGTKTHVFVTANTYIITLTGTAPYLRFDYSGSAPLIKAIGVPPSTFGTGSDAFSRMFTGCTSLLQVPADFGRFNTAITYFAYNETFKGCTGLISIPRNFGRFNTTLSNYSYDQTFWGCTSLASIPSDFGMFNTYTIANSFTHTFSGATGLSGDAPALWDRYTGATNGADCFLGCVNASNFATIPSGWK